MERVDAVVAGAGVVGLATARALAARGRHVLVIEAGPATGSGASSRSSEVIHAGIYYPPGSRKARHCVAGREQLYAYCRERGVEHRRVGKLILAVDAAELRLLEGYRSRALANGVDDLLWLSAGQVAGLEPGLRCVGALLSPSTGILDSRALLLALQGDLERDAGAVVLRSRVTGARRGPGGFAVAVDGAEAIACAEFVNAAGLQAPALAHAIEGMSPAAIPQARFAAGHYYGLRGRPPSRRLVYPVASRGGLGIHLTIDLGGQARFGPDVDWRDTADYRFDESRRGAFAAAVRRYWPALDEDRLTPAYVGVRARIHGPDDEPADFLVQGPGEHGIAGLVNLFGIESPGLTASFAIAGEVAGLLDASARGSP